MIEDVLQYAGKRVVVTGCASGMGAATAQILVDLDAEVIGLDVKATDVAVHRSIGIDLRDRASIDAAVAEIDAFVGPSGRRSTAEEQAWPLVFLNSPRSSYVAGEALHTDAGFLGAMVTGQIDVSMPE